MDTYTALLILISVLLSILMIVTTIFIVLLIKLVQSIRRIAVKAEGVVDSVEEAAEVFKDTQGKLAIVKIIHNIVQMVHGKKK